MNQDDAWKFAPRAVSPAMRDAAQEAARAYLLETGGTSPDTIWQAMWDQAPGAPRNDGLRLLVAVSALALQTGEKVERLIDWLAEQGGLLQLFEARLIQPNDSTRLQFLLPIVCGGPQADSHAEAVVDAVLGGYTGVALVDAAMRFAQDATVEAEDLVYPTLLSAPARRGR